MWYSTGITFFKLKKAAANSEKGIRLQYFLSEFFLVANAHERYVGYLASQPYPKTIGSHLLQVLDSASAYHYKNELEVAL